MVAAKMVMEAVGGDVGKYPDQWQRLGHRKILRKPRAIHSAGILSKPLGF